MKKTTHLIALFATVAALLTFNSCTKDPDPAPVDEQEEFDDVRLQFITLNADGSETTDTTSVTFDQQGVPSPSHSHLEPHTTYRLLITLFYKGNNINHEITEEGTEHQFFFLPSVAEGIENYSYNDRDEDSRGIGLDGNITIGEGEFDLQIVLRHGLDKAHSAAQAWNSTNYHEAGGSDDLNVSFEIHAEH